MKALTAGESILASPLPSDKLLQFITLYVSTGSPATAYRSVYGDGPGTPSYQDHKLGAQLAASDEVRAYLDTRRQLAQDTVLEHLPPAILRLSTIALSDDTPPKTALLAIKLLAELAGLLKTDQAGVNVLIQNLASLHPQ